MRLGCCGCVEYVGLAQSRGANRHALSVAAVVLRQNCLCKLFRGVGPCFLRRQRQRATVVVASLYVIGTGETTTAGSNASQVVTAKVMCGSSGVRHHRLHTKLQAAWVYVSGFLPVHHEGIDSHSRRAFLLGCTIGYASSNNKTHIGITTTKASTATTTTTAKPPSSSVPLLLARAGISLLATQVERFPFFVIARMPLRGDPTRTFSDTIAQSGAAVMTDWKALVKLRDPLQASPEGCSARPRA